MNTTDNHITAKIRDRDEQGFYLLMDAYLNYVTAIVSNLAREILKAEDMEEIAADVFIAVWDHIDQLKQPEGLKPYIAQIARNKTFSRLRKEKQEFIPFDDDILIFSKDGLPDEAIMQKEQETILNQAVASFEEPDREIFIRFYYFGEKIKQISERLKINQATIKTKLHRSRKQIKVRFEERGYRYEN